MITSKAVAQSASIFLAVFTVTLGGALPAGNAASAEPPAAAASPDAGAPPGRVHGMLDKEIIRRVIRRHINEVKACYQRELSGDPELEGRIVVRFTIDGSGMVIASERVSSTMGNGIVEDCTVQAVKRWQFPKPIGGGMVIVTYPFALTPAGTNAPAPRDMKFEWLVPDRLLIHRSMDPIAGSANALIAVTDRGLILIDAPWTDAQTEEILRYGQYALQRPWIGAVITHDHRESAGGLGAVLRSGIPTAALDLTVAKLEKRGVHGVKSLFAAAAGAFKDPRGFEAFYPGPGHAPDNLVVAFPAWNAVFAGCLISSGELAELGVTVDADRRTWPAAVRRVQQRYPTPGVLIPGHGAVDRSASAYRHTLDLFALAASRSGD